MKDNLKIYISQHKEDFDDVVVSRHLFSSVLNKMDKRKSRRRKTRYYMAAAACLIVLLTLSIQFLYYQPVVQQVQPPVVIREERLSAPPGVIHQIGLPGKVDRQIANQKNVVSEKNRESGEKYLAALQDSNSVASRIGAILTINSMRQPGTQLISALCNSFENDESSNVRLAALNVLMKYPEDSLVQKMLLNSLVLQKDPVIQLELVSAMKNNADPEITQTLIKLAEDPFTITPVKDQIYYTLLERPQ